jgi:tRNA (uracil-5-)-methyltransferase
MATEAILDTSHADVTAEKALSSIESKDKERHIRGKKRKLKGPTTSEGSHDEVLSADVRSLLARLNLKGSKSSKQPERFEEIEVTIEEISSTGDGLGHLEGSNRIFAVPFTSPGDVVQAKFIREDSNTNTMVTDFLKVIKPSPLRNNDLIKCRYFASCSGCQFQMLPYADQLVHKKTIVEKAYRNFSGLPASVMPPIGDTMGSPLEYGYRTKLTPHFDGPPGQRRAGRKGEKAKFDEVPPIGFMLKGTRKTIDIEECPIATDAVQMGLRRERKRVAEDIDKYHKGATILLRESTQRTKADEQEPEILGLDETTQTVYENRGEYIHAKTCITDNNATTTEYVEDFVFENNANSFFQNNNSILPTFTEYIRSQILAAASRGGQKMQNLIDAYSGSGLFTITLSNMFERSLGIDIDVQGITYAKRNARLNALAPLESSDINAFTTSSTTSSDKANTPTTSAETVAEAETPVEPRVNFIAATASELFSSVTTWDASRTVVLCDPPRKGCDTSFPCSCLLSSQPSSSTSAVMSTRKRGTWGSC